MPTGYTAALYEGEDVSFRDFVLRCSRAMGAAVLLRDHDSSVVPTPENVNGGSGYYTSRLQDARTELLHWQELKGPALEEATETFNAAQRQGLADDEAKRVRIGESYTGMIDQVEAWEPPTPDHQGLKDFMLQQLNDSLEHDASPTDPRWYQEYLPGDLRDMKIGNLTQEIERLEKSAEEDKERDQGRVEWVEALYASLPAATVSDHA